MAKQEKYQGQRMEHPRITVQPYDQEKGRGKIGKIDVFLQPYRDNNYLINSRKRLAYRIEEEHDASAVVIQVTDKSLIHRLLHQAQKDHLG